jgi:hypothetical protein
MKRIKLKEIQQDEKNFNRHTVQGMELLKKSVEKVGIIESITVSDDDKIITGNARQETISEVYGENVEPIVIETDGTQPIIIKRKDIKSGTKKFHEAALLANTTATKNINLNMDLIQEIAVEEYNIDLVEIGVQDLTNDPYKEFSNFGEFDYSNMDCTAYKRLIVNFDNDADFKKFCELTGLQITVKTVSTYFPQKQKETLQNYEQQ